MTTALLVIGNGRLDYLHDTVEAALTYLPEMDHYLMIDDSGEPSVWRELQRNYGDFQIVHHPHNKGMAQAVQAGFDLVLATDADFVFWLEEDMVLTGAPPVEEAVDVLRGYPYIAQILFQRQPISPEEHKAGSVVGAMNAWKYQWDDGHENPWSEHRHIFSLNPCLIPRNVLELGWDADNERGMTKKLLDHGFTFGVWDGQYVEHIGTRRGKQWRL